MSLLLPIEALSAAIYHAAHVSFPGIPMSDRSSIDINQKYSMLEHVRRPEPRDVRLLAMYPQLWGSSTLGFGSMGVAAMTTAYTVVVADEKSCMAVYWNGRHAYTMENASMTAVQLSNLDFDILHGTSASVREAAIRYGAKPGV